MIMKTVTVGAIDTNCYIIIDEVTNKGVIIDPGAEANSILEQVKDSHYEIEYILLTHGHYDHIGAVEAVKKGLNDRPKIVIHEKEAIYLSDPAKNFSAYQMMDRIAFEADVFLKDNESIQVGQLEFKTLTVPGHTVASLCYLLEKQGILIAGDTLFYHSIGTSAYYNGPNTDLGKNIIEKLFVLDPKTVVFPGHGPRTTVQEEMNNNPYLSSNTDTPDPWEL